MPTANLFSLPIEVLLDILFLLDIPDILSFGKTCSSAKILTVDRAVWIQILQEYQRYLPLPFFSGKILSHLSTPCLEALVRDTFHAQSAWSKPRTGPPIELKKPNLEGSILSLEVLLDRWIVAITSGGLLVLWDSDSPCPDAEPAAVPSCLTFDLTHGGAVPTRGWTGSVLRLDGARQNLIIGMTARNDSTMMYIYQIPLTLNIAQARLAPGLEGSFEPCPYSTCERSSPKLLATISSPAMLVIRDIDPIHCLAIYSRSGLGMLDIVSWHTQTGNAQGYQGQEGQKGATINAQSDEAEDLWNGIIAVRFAAPYIIVAKNRCLELHPLPVSEPSSIGNESNLNKHMKHVPLPVLKESFGYTTFRDISISDITYTPLPFDAYPTLETRFTFLAYDVLQGLFRYDVRVVIPGLQAPTPSLNEQNASDSELSAPCVLPPPFLELTLVGVYPMAQNLGALSPSPRVPASITIPMPGTPNSEAPTPTPFQRNFGGDGLPMLRALASTNSGSITPNSAKSKLPAPVTSTPSGGPTSRDNGLLSSSPSGASNNIAARGFVSAFCLGPQGRRAVWVERSRGSTIRDFIVWGLDAEHDASDSRNQTVEIERKAVWRVSSYDLRDDITHCAFGEVHGLIAFANRAGELYILPMRRCIGHVST